MKFLHCGKLPLRVIVRTCHQEVRVRFAPSPTGGLHLGGLRTALYNYLFCRSRGGQFILRIEDTDQTRLVSGASDQLKRILEWSGINVNEGPDIGGEYGPYVQSQRLSIYKEMSQRLLQIGAAYRCFCSPERLDMLRRHAIARGETPRYDNRCRHLSSQEVADKSADNLPFTLRFKLQPLEQPWNDLVYGLISSHSANNEGDQIIIKSDGYPTYHFANVVDDHLMKITHVLRGVEWQISTAKHLLLYEAFGWKPPTFAHLPLLMNRSGKKLSKRQQDVHVEYYKDLGYFPESVLNLVTNMGSGFSGQSTAGMNMEQLIKHFDLKSVNTNSTRVDFDRIEDLNRLHLRTFLKSDSGRRELVSNLRQLVHDKYITGDSRLQEHLTDTYFLHILDWSKDRITLVSDLLKPEYEFLWSEPRMVGRDLVSDVEREMVEETIRVLRTLSADDFTVQGLSSKLHDLTAQRSWTFKEYMKILRQVTTALKVGPSVAEIMTALGKDLTIARLQATANH